jgi:hypothetical protein
MRPAISPGGLGKPLVVYQYLYNGFHRNQGALHEQPDFKNAMVDQIETFWADGAEVPEIAEFLGLAQDAVQTVVDAYEDRMLQDDDFDGCDEPYDSMDGDFDSAMASAGMGTDEDYGYYGDE